MEREAAERAYRELLDLPDGEEKQALLRELGARDLYFLLTCICRRHDMRKDWVFERCREVQAAPDGHLDLWHRGGYKSSIITFGMSLLEIIRDPEITIGIFSHTRPIAKAFLRQLKLEMERNPLLSAIWPDIFWANPRGESPVWSDDSGLLVKRKGNPKEQTVEAWGMVEGAPVGKHFRLQVFDDVVTAESVTTPDMLAKTLEAWELALNLVAHPFRRRTIGTRYHFNDAYQTMIEREAAVLREHPAEGEDGAPATFLTREELDQKRREMGIRTYAAQMLLRPTADSLQGFRLDWLRHHDPVEAPGYGLNRYIVVDPAHSKKKESDYTAIWVVGAGADQNWHVCEFIRDRLNLSERVEAVIRLHRKWRPLKVGYERYGMQADIEALKHRMRLETYYFDVVELAGKLQKVDRIDRLRPIFEEGRIWLPHTQYKTLYDGKTYDLIEVFTHQEYLAFPAARHDDMLDALSRICDEEMAVVWPRAYDDTLGPRDPYAPNEDTSGSAWAA